MRRIEVENNIRYNENLIRQYQKSINQLYAKINDSNNQINKYNNNIALQKNEINKFNSQIDELRNLKKKYQNLQDIFSQKQQKRIKTINKGLSYCNSLQSMEHYKSDINTLLRSQEYFNAFNQLSSAISIITDRINKTVNQINSVQMDITHNNRLIASKYYDNNNNQSQINSLNNAIVYRKNRITYWQNQLKYAI